jgi:hypothetical protein
MTLVERLGRRCQFTKERDVVHARILPAWFRTARFSDP